MFRFFQTKLRHLPRQNLSILPDKFSLKIHDNNVTMQMCSKICIGFLPCGYCCKGDQRIDSTCCASVNWPKDAGVTAMARASVACLPFPKPETLARERESLRVGATEQRRNIALLECADQGGHGFRLFNRKLRQNGFLQPRLLCFSEGKSGCLFIELKRLVGEQDMRSQLE